MDYQVAALLADKGDTLKITGAHNIDASQGLAAEIARSLNKDEATIVTLGYTPVSPLHVIVTDWPNALRHSSVHIIGMTNVSSVPYSTTPLGFVLATSRRIAQFTSQLACLQLWRAIAFYSVFQGIQDRNVSISHVRI